MIHIIAVHLVVMMTSNGNEAAREIEAQLTASRYQFDSPESFIELLKEKIKINTETVCPFGMPLVEQALPTEEELEEEDALPVVDVTIPLSEVVAAIPVNAIFGKRQMFMSGSRIVRQGQSLPVQYRGQNYQLKVESITPAGINFKEVNTDEEALRALSKPIVKRVNSSSKGRSERLQSLQNSASQPLVLGADPIKIK